MSDRRPEEIAINFGGGRTLEKDGDNLQTVIYTNIEDQAPLPTSLDDIYARASSTNPCARSKLTDV